MESLRSERAASMPVNPNLKSCCVRLRFCTRQIKRAAVDIEIIRIDGIDVWPSGF